MSKVRIYGDVSGYVDIAVPDNAGTTTLNLDKIPQADINGNIAMDTNTLYVDAANNRVGVGTASPNTTLDIVSPSSAEAINIRGRSADDIGQLKFYENDGTTSLARLDSRTTHFEVGSYNELRFSAGGVNNSHVVIDTSGNVGIGTDNPGYKLQVNGNVDILNVKGSLGNAFVRFTDGDATADFSIGADDGSGAGAGGFILYDRSNTAYRLVVKSNGYVGIGTTNPSQILEAQTSSTTYVTATTTGTATSAGHRSTAGTNDWVWFATQGQPNYRLYDYASSAVRLTVTNSGNVGIGTDNPQAKLHVTSNVLIEGGSTDSRTIGFTNASGSTGWSIGNGIIDSTHNFRIYDNTAGAARFTVDGNGKVGIGTSNPTGKLHVYDSGVMDINLVGNPPELNLEDTSSSSGSKRIRLTVDTGKMSIQGLSDDDQSITYTFLEGDLSNGNLYLDNINGHQLSHRNLINNGGMQIAQRNASYTITTSGYQYICLDRWGNYYAGTSVGQQEQTVFNQLKKVMRITATSSTSNLYTFQWIENGGKMLCNGERFSISFKARSSVASGKTCTVQMRYGDVGAGNTATSDTIGSVALTNSFQQFKFENVDASSFNYTQAGLWLWMPGPSIGDYFEITDVQVELGSKATKFEQKSIAQEMNDCMRFYQRLQGNRDGSGGAAGDRGIFHMHNWGTTNWYGIHHFNVPMRTGPTLKTGFSGTYLGTWFSGGNTSNATSMQIQNANSWRAEMSGNHDGSFLQGGSCWLRLGADDNYVAFDAEYL